MRMQMRTRAMALVLGLGCALPGCNLVLGLDQLQGGDAGSAGDGGGADAGARDAGPDAARDAGPPRDGARLPDAGDDAGEMLPDAAMIDGGEMLPDAAMFDAGARDGGVDAAAPTDAGVDASGNDAGVDAARTDAGTSVTVGGTVIGLAAGEMLVLRNGTATQTVTGSGSRSDTFSFDVASGSAYAIDAQSEPTNVMCLVYRGDGTATSAVSNVVVGCSTSAGLVSYFPFDGSQHAARGSDWDGLGNALSYVTDRWGQASHALDATTGTAMYLLRRLDGSGSAPANGTQFTVSLWALVPASYTPAVGFEDGLFTHFGPSSLEVQAEVYWPGGNPSFAIYFYWDGGFDRALIPSTTVLGRDEWHHVTISASGPSGVPDSFTRTVYVDGARANSLTTCCGWGNVGDRWGMGATRIRRDDARLYSRMLSDAEVAAIYAAERFRP